MHRSLNDEDRYENEFWHEINLVRKSLGEA